MPALSIKRQTFCLRNVCLLVALFLLSCLLGKFNLGSPAPVQAADHQTNIMPVAPALTHVQQISAHGDYTCALLEDGTAKCWGDNRKGQLGNGDYDNRNTPTTVQWLSNASAIATGINHTCAVVEGEVECWGANQFGQLGNDSTDDSTTPVKTSGMGDVVALGLGNANTCALQQTGVVQCWGRGLDSQPDNLTPSPVTGLAASAVHITTGAEHTCVVLDTGAIQCWGSNAFGQLGNGTKIRSTEPVTVSGISDAQSVFAGHAHTCALLKAGNVMCWGLKTQGELGDGTIGNSSTVPVHVIGINATVEALALGSMHTCALTDNAVKCWGSNYYGQLGLILPSPGSATPQVVTGLAGKVKQIAAGEAHTCALLEDTTVQCWGRNNSGALGDGTNDDSTLPVTVIDPEAQCTETPTAEVTEEPTDEATETPTDEVTETPTDEVTEEPTDEITDTPTDEPTETEEPTETDEPTLTATPTRTKVHTPTPTFTAMASATGTFTPSPSATATATPTFTPKPSETSTPTPSPTRTATLAPTATPTTGTTLAVDSITPNHGVNSGKTNVTIHGANFGATPKVKLGNRVLSEVVFVDATQLLAVIPADLPPATYALSVTNPDGQSAKLEQAFTVEPAAVSVLKVQPGRGSANVPNDVIIIGFNFMNGAQASLNTTPPVQLATTYVSSLNLLATIPAGLAPGVYELTVTNPGGSSATLPNGYQVLPADNDDLSSSEENLWADPQPLRAQKATQLGLVVHRQGGKNPLTGVKVRFTVQDPTQASLVLGDAEIIEPISPRSDASTVGLDWTPTAAGSYIVTAVIDPDNQITESDETNNTVHHTFIVLPADLDQLAPHVDNLTINQGATDTTIPTVTLAITATDPTQPPPSSGVSTALFVEYIYNQSADQWVPVQTSSWQPYATAHDSYPWVLLPRAGLHYVKGWAADQAGNISTYPFRALTNYIPAVDHVEQNQARVYRYSLTAGQHLQVKVEPLHGDPDLYVWAPDYASGGRPPYVSNLDGEGTVDQVNLIAPVNGVYQIEIYGYSAADYRLTVTISAGSNVEAAAQTSSIAANKPVYTQPLIPLDSAPSDRQSLPSAPNIPTGIPAATNSAIYLPVVRR